MATDTAFAVALIVMMGRRVPVELRIFLTAAAIVDDIGAIAVVAAFYSGALNLFYLAGVILAIFIPTRKPPNMKALMIQANSIIAAEARHRDEVLRWGPSAPALRALDAIHDRLESPADRLLRHAGARSSYLVLPLFAFANAGVVLSLSVLEGHQPLMIAILAGLVIGKPLGLVGASALAAWRCCGTPSGRRIPNRRLDLCSAPIARSAIGAPDRIRTCDLRLRRATLYPAELRVLTVRTLYPNGFKS